jgi:hypothetical protein
VVPINIQDRPKVLYRFKAAHKPLVKTLFNFENMESHGKPIKLVLHQLITCTLPKEGITLLKLFGAIGTSLKALLQSSMVVGRFGAYVECLIDQGSKFRGEFQDLPYITMG